MVNDCTKCIFYEEERIPYKCVKDLNVDDVMFGDGCKIGVEKPTVAKAPKIESITPEDKVGVRNTVTNLIEQLDRKDLKAVIISHRDNDGKVTTFWNGKEENCNLLCDIVKKDILDSYYMAEHVEYDDIDEE